MLHVQMETLSGGTHLLDFSIGGTLGALTGLSGSCHLD